MEKASNKDLAADSPSSRIPDIPQIDTGSPASSHDDSSSRTAFGAGSEKESAGNVVIEAPSDSEAMQSRIESQKTKEKQDQQIKIILDRVLWASCGVCLIAIVWVMTVRISGCNQEPTTIVRDEEPVKDPAIRSQKISPQKRLERGAVSPLAADRAGLENKLPTGEAKNKTRRPGSESRNNESVRQKISQGESKRAGSSLSSTESIKETIGFFDFNQPVRRSDILPGLAPLRLKKAIWKKEATGGYLQFDPQTRVVVESEKAFDNVKALTLVMRFRTNENKRPQVLFAIKGKLIVQLEQGQLKLGDQGRVTTQGTGDQLADGNWHRVAVTLGDRSKVWLDGKFAGEFPIPIPAFAGLKEDSEIGFHSAQPDSYFVGELDNLGMYWIELDESQILSQVGP